MSNVTISPNMNLPVPIVGTEIGPDWATDYNACMSTIDGHNHSSSSGVQITPDGLNISSDLTFLINNATNLRSVRFYTQSAPLSGTSDVGCIYESGVDLYYNDGNGNQIRITQSGSVAGSAGSITGLPSGTASASYSAGTFTWQGATSTPATMATGPLIVGNAVASSKTVTISPNSGIASNYAFTLPAGLPAALNYMTFDASGNVAYNTSGVTGSGAVVLATSPTISTPTISSPTISTPTISTPTMSNPTFSGTSSGTITSGTFTPTLTYVGNSPSVLTTNLGRYKRINDNLYVTGLIQFTSSATAGGTGVNTITLPIATTSLILTGGIGTLRRVSDDTTNTKVLQSSGTTLIVLDNYLSDTASVFVITYSYTYLIV